MIPGLTSAAEARIAALLDSTVTDIDAASFAGRDFIMLDAHEAEARQLGIDCVSAQGCSVVVTDRTRPLGRVRLEVGGLANVVFFDNHAWGGNCFANIRILGSECVVFFNDIGDGYVSMPDVFMRSSEQVLFWGRGATAVGCNIELEGDQRGVVIGDDALISSGVWIRNYDMHAIHDLITGVRLSRPPVDTVLERHVWLGQDALLLNCPRVGTGAILGARALAKAPVPSCVIAVGTPARVVRENVSWGRDTYAMTTDERVRLGYPPDTGQDHTIRSKPVAAVPGLR